MGKKVLFSPLGGTDPVSESNYADGAMIHIARHWKPDLIYLYYSDEIREKQKKDLENNSVDRYIYCLKQLEESLNHTFEVHDVLDIVNFDDEDLIEARKNVHLFGINYKIYNKILEAVRPTMEDDDELLLNISSGTPAMKSALIVLATMIDLPCKCIQVDTPTKRMNEHIHDKKLTWDDIETMWLLNPDNTGDSMDRTHVEEIPTLEILKFQKTIRDYIHVYNYEAALKLAENIEPTATYIKKLEIATARRQLNEEKIEQLLYGVKKEEYEPYRPLFTDYHGGENKRIREACEYILDLQAKAFNHENANFLRGISPILEHLFEDMISNNSSFQPGQYIKEDSERKRSWDISKINELKNQEDFEWLSNFKMNSQEFVTTSHLIYLMEKLIDEDRVKSCALILRDLEIYARNVAAHTIVSVPDEWIEEKLLTLESSYKGYKNNTKGEILAEINKKGGNPCEKITSLLKKAFYYAYEISETDKCWDSYNQMNENIEKAIEC